MRDTKKPRKRPGYIDGTPVNARSYLLGGGGADGAVGLTIALGDGGGFLPSCVTPLRAGVGIG